MLMHGVLETDKPLRTRCESSNSALTRKAILMSSAEPGRNERCPCGSGRKYKQCCLQTKRAFEASSRATDDRMILCWAVERVKARVPVPRFENRLYEADTEQARFLLQVCAEGGRVAFMLGGKVTAKYWTRSKASR